MNSKYQIKKNINHIDIYKVLETIETCLQIFIKYLRKRNKLLKDNLLKEIDKSINFIVFNSKDISYVLYENKYSNEKLKEIMNSYNAFYILYNRYKDTNNDNIKINSWLKIFSLWFVITTKYIILSNSTFNIYELNDLLIKSEISVHLNFIIEMLAKNNYDTIYYVIIQNIVLNLNLWIGYKIK